MPTIDHDPKELSRKALKYVSVATIAITIAILIPINMGVRWAVDQLPMELTFLLFGLIIGLSAGIFLRRWDALRHHRTLGKDG